MKSAYRQYEQIQACEVIDFDAALLNACPEDERADLMVEARMVAQAFSETGAADEL